MIQFSFFFRPPPRTVRASCLTANLTYLLDAVINKRISIQAYTRRGAQLRAPRSSHIARHELLFVSTEKERNLHLVCPHAEIMFAGCAVVKAGRLAGRLGPGQGAFSAGLKVNTTTGPHKTSAKLQCPRFFACFRLGSARTRTSKVASTRKMEQTHPNLTQSRPFSNYAH